MVQARYQTTLSSVTKVAEIEEYCEEHGLSESEFTRRALVHFLNTEVRE